MARPERPAGESAKKRAAARARAAGLRAGRKAAYEAFFSPGALAAAGAAISVAFLLQDSLALKGLMFAAFAFAAWRSGKRSSVAATIAAAAGIVAANLLVRVGKVLLTVGPLQVTEHALLDGIDKALTFEGLVYASKAAIMPSLRLPGRLGAVIASAFVYYDRIVEYAGKIRPASLISDADDLMLRVWEGETAEPSPECRAVRPVAGYAVLAASVLASFAALTLK